MAIGRKLGLMGYKIKRKMTHYAQDHPLRNPFKNQTTLTESAQTSFKAARFFRNGLFGQRK